jgi:hypothetical protein
MVIDGQNFSPAVLAEIETGMQMPTFQQLSKDEVFDLIRKAGIEVTPTTREISRFEKPWWGLGRREVKVVETIFSVGDKGRIPDFDILSIYMEIHVDGKKVKVTPSSASFCTRSEFGGYFSVSDGFTCPAEKLILEFFPTVEFRLSEELVRMPMPSWVEPVDDHGYSAGLRQRWYFRSEAERLWAVFLGKGRFVPAGK